VLIVVLLEFSASPIETAAVATYIRSVPGNKGGPVTEQDVTAVK